MKTNVDGINISYDKFGKGSKTILFLHGWHQDFGYKKYQKLLDCLSKNYQVYALDFPGFGESDLYKKPWQVSDFSALVSKFIQKEKIKQSILVSHSFGGRVAALLCSHQQTSSYFSHLVLIDSAGIEIKSLKTKLIIAISKIVPTPLKSKFRHHFSSDYSSLQGLKKETFKKVISQDLQDYFKNITIPTLILWGGLDHTTPIKHANILHHSIKNSQLIVSPQDNHGLPYRNPSFVCKNINKFLKQ